MRFRLFPLLCLLLFSSLAQAQYSEVVGPTTRPSLSIIDRETGHPSGVYTHDGQQWVAGESGRRYALRLRNRSGQRVLAAVSVDGVNVVSGKTASISQEGYVLEPYQSVDITGWRKSYASVAAFVFSHPYMPDWSGRHYSPRPFPESGFVPDP